LCHLEKEKTMQATRTIGGALVLVSFVFLVGAFGQTQSSSAGSSSNTNNIPICGPPTSISLTWSNGNQALPLGSPASALMDATMNITELLQTSAIVNLTLNSIPLQSISDIGILLLTVADSVNLNVSTHNQNNFSLDIFEAAYAIYQDGITVPLNDTYGFINASNSIYASNVHFFTNGATDEGAYLGTVSILSDTNVTGVECESMFYYLVIWNPTEVVGASAVGDPMFTTLTQSTFQIHGYADNYLNIWCTEDVILNARFALLEANNDEETSRLMQRHNGISSYARSHVGTYLDTVAILTSMSDRILVQAGTMEQGFALVTVDDVRMEPDSYAQTISSLVVFKVDFIDNQTVVITIDNQFTIYIINCDSFLNIARLVSHTTHGNGLIGGTHHRKLYPDSDLKYVPGKVDDYVVVSNDPFGTDFVFNDFHELSLKPSKPIFKYYD
jgi:hypothetical protein